MTLNVFGNVFFSLLIAALAFCVFALIACFKSDDSVRMRFGIVACSVTVAVFVVSLLTCITISSNGEREFAEKFIVQKTTIEQSLESEHLSGLEKIELVNKAVDLNGELAERKLKLTRWYNVLWDKGVYKDIDYIKFE